MAVFSPTPGTPGMLSEESPISAFRSTMTGGAKPYSSSKRFSSYRTVSVCPMRVFTWRTAVPFPISWKLSLSPVTATQSQPASAQAEAMVPIRSSASQPASSYRGTFMASSTSFRIGIWTDSSSGMAFLWAL